MQNIWESIHVLKVCLFFFFFFNRSFIWSMLWYAAISSTPEKLNDQFGTKLSDSQRRAGSEVVFFPFSIYNFSHISYMIVPLKPFSFFFLVAFVFLIIQFFKSFLNQQRNSMIWRWGDCCQKLLKYIKRQIFLKNSPRYNLVHA